LSKKDQSPGCSSGERLPNGGTPGESQEKCLVRLEGSNTTQSPKGGGGEQNIPSRGIVQKEKPKPKSEVLQIEVSKVKGERPSEKKSRAFVGRAAAEGQSG